MKFNYLYTGKHDIVDSENISGSIFYIYRSTSLLILIKKNLKQRTLEKSTFFPLRFPISLIFFEIAAFLRTVKHTSVLLL